MKANRRIIESQGLDKFIQGKLDKYKFKVGILENKQHYAPLRQGTTGKKGLPILYNYAGLFLYKHGKKPDGTLWGIAKKLDAAYKWLRKPFLLRKNQDLISVINFMIDDMNGRESKQRMVNAIQAVVRNPILRGDYGRNSRDWAKKKGFNKLMFMTGQFFKNIQARLF